MGRPWVLLMGFLVFGGGCGVPEPIYVENTPPEIYWYWPSQPSVNVAQGSEGQRFTICANDAEGGLIDYYWTVNGEKRQGEIDGTMCGRSPGSTFSITGTSFTLGTPVYITAVAADDHAAKTSHLWVLGILP